jgi:hypothetical protein
MGTMLRKGTLFSLIYRLFRASNSQFTEAPSLFSASLLHLPHTLWITVGQGDKVYFPVRLPVFS